jgi:hypothetical protein
VRGAAGKTKTAPEGGPFVALLVLLFFVLALVFLEIRGFSAHITKLSFLF